MNRHLLLDETLHPSTHPIKIHRTTNSVEKLLQTKRLELIQSKQARFDSNSTKNRYWDCQKEYICLKSIWNIQYLAQLPITAFDRLHENKQSCYFDIWRDTDIHIELGFSEHDIHIIIDECEIIIWHNAQLACSSSDQHLFNNLSNSQIKQLNALNDSNWALLLKTVDISTIILYCLLHNVSKQSYQRQIIEHLTTFCNIEALTF